MSVGNGRRVLFPGGKGFLGVWGPI